MRVATVAGRPVTLADVRARVATIRHGGAAARLPAPATPEARRLDRWVLQLLVNEAVLEHEARARGIRPATPRLATSALFEAVTADVTVPERALRDYYDASADRYRQAAECRVRHVLLRDERSARKVASRLAAGEDMAAVAREVSQDRGSRARGGDLGIVRRGELAGPFEDLAFTAPLWEVAGPVRTEFGWHLLRVEARRAERLRPYEKVRPGIAAELLAAARRRAFDDWLQARRGALAHLEPDWLHPGDPRLPDSVHRH